MSIKLNSVTNTYKVIFKKTKKLIKKNKISFSVIFLPIFIVGFYSLAIQSPRYESYAVISIKQNKEGVTSLLAGSLLGGLTGSDAAAPSQVVIDYINSIDMYTKLDQQIGLSKMLKSHKIDLISRMKSNPDQYDILKYYNSLLAAFYNSQSQTIELKFQAFSPFDSQIALQQIIQDVQDFVNNLDQQLVSQRINFGKKQVLLAHKKLVDAESKIIVFQNNKNMFDPKTETGVIIGILSNLQLQLVRSQTDLADKSAYYQADSIEIQSIQQRIDTIKAQINVQKQRLIGVSGGSTNDLKLNQILGQFEELSTEAKLAGAEYAASIQGLEMSRSEAIQQKQQVVIVQAPSLPDYHKYPRVWYNIMIMFIMLVMLYGVIKMFIRIIEEQNY